MRIYQWQTIRIDKYKNNKSRNNNNRLLLYSELNLIERYKVWEGYKRRRRRERSHTVPYFGHSEFFSALDFYEQDGPQTKRSRTDKICHKIKSLLIVYHSFQQTNGVRIWVVLNKSSCESPQVTIRYHISNFQPACKHTSTYSSITNISCLRLCCSKDRGRLARVTTASSPHLPALPDPS